MKGITQKKTSNLKKTVAVGAVMATAAAGAGVATALLSKQENRKKVDRLAKKVGKAGTEVASLMQERVAKMKTNGTKMGTTAVKKSLPKKIPMTSSTAKA